eukprot:5026553-Prorocentrum_lima.AAC.1
MGLGGGAPPGLQPRCEPEDGAVWTWPSGLGQGPGGSLQCGVPGVESPGPRLRSGDAWGA